MAQNKLWLIEKPVANGTSLYLTMIPGIRQTKFLPNPDKAMAFRCRDDAANYAATFFVPGSGVRAALKEDRG